MHIISYHIYIYIKWYKHMMFYVCILCRNGVPGPWTGGRWSSSPAVGHGLRYLQRQSCGLCYPGENPLRKTVAEIMGYQWDIMGTLW